MACHRDASKRSHHVQGRPEQPQQQDGAQQRDQERQQHREQHVGMALRYQRPLEGPRAMPAAPVAALPAGGDDLISGRGTVTARPENGYAG